VIDLTGFGLTFGALQGLMSQSGTDVKITINAVTVLTLHDVTVAGLGPSDFLLA